MQNFFYFPILQSLDFLQTKKKTVNNSINQYAKTKIKNQNIVSNLPGLFGNPIDWMGISALVPISLCPSVDGRDSLH